MTREDLQEQDHFLPAWQFSYRNNHGSDHVAQIKLSHIDLNFSELTGLNFIGLNIEFFCDTSGFKVGKPFPKKNTNSTVDVNSESSSYNAWFIAFLCLVTFLGLLLLAALIIAFLIRWRKRKYRARSKANPEAQPSLTTDKTTAQQTDDENLDDYENVELRAAYDDATTQIRIERNHNAADYVNSTPEAAADATEARLISSGQYAPLDTAERCADYVSPYESLRD